MSDSKLEVVLRTHRAMAAAARAEEAHHRAIELATEPKQTGERVAAREARKISEAAALWHEGRARGVAQAINEEAG